MFARAEALHAHGHTREACRLAQRLAEELLTNPPDLLAETANLPLVKGRWIVQKIYHFNENKHKISRILEFKQIELQYKD